MGQVECPAEGLYWLEKVWAYEAKYVLQDGEWIPETVIDFLGAAPLREALLPLIAQDTIEWMPTSHRIDVLYAKAGASNWGHVLTDMAPKLVNLAKADLGPVRLHVPAESAKFADFLGGIARALGIDAEIKVGRTAELMRFRRCLFLSPVAKHNIRKSPSLLALRDTALKMFGQAGERRIFVTRPANEQRSIINSQAIEAQFTRRGFEVVHPAMPPAEQVALFSQARMIAGPLGAGLSNLIFAPRDAEILMIDPGLTDCFFWDAAALIGQRFHWHFAGPAVAYDQTLASSAFAVEEPALEATLRQMDW
ncbi:MAG: glycosyltransferase family 61 protein [Burkholderiales bacterium]|nr:glycosyltransferase family 61 protein [Burkholderiales bacterium]